MPRLWQYACVVAGYRVSPAGDAATVIGAALAARRAVLDRATFGRPEGTVRGWLRRFAARAGPIREGFTALAYELDPDPDAAGSGRSPLADPVAAVTAAAQAAAHRWGSAMLTVSAWELAAAITSGPEANGDAGQHESPLPTWWVGAAASSLVDLHPSDRRR